MQPHNSREQLGELSWAQLLHEIRGASHEAVHPYLGGKVWKGGVDNQHGHKGLGMKERMVAMNSCVIIMMQYKKA